MFTAAEFARGIKGAIGFLQRDPAAPTCFENTAEACLRSFRIMLLVAPLHAILMLIRYSYVITPADDLDIFAVETLRYIVDWLLFPVVFFEIARRRNWLALYPRYISALNWVNVPAMAIAVVGLAVAILVPASVAELIRLALQALFFFWFLQASRAVLNIGWGIASLLLIVNWVPSIFVSLIVDRYLGIAAIP